MATLQSIEENRYLSGWVARATGDNVDAVATQNGVAGKNHYVASVSAGFTAAATKNLQIKDGTTVIFEVPVTNTATFHFPVPLKITAGNAVSAVLAASGTAGNVGYVNMVGFTV